MAGRNLKPGGFDSTDKMHSNTLKVKNISVMFGPTYEQLKLEEKEVIQCTQLICELFYRGSQCCNVSLLKWVVSAFIFQGSDSPGSHNRLRGGGRRPGGHKESGSFRPQTISSPTRRFPPGRFSPSRFTPRPINRAPLGHTRFYCQGALFPWPDKTRNQFPIQFFTISRRYHSKWFGRFINHISDHALSLKQTLNRPLIPDSYPFLLPNSMMWAEISSHIGN